jgi:hypothetical protein
MVSTLARDAGADQTSVDDARTPPAAAHAAKIELTGVTKRFVSPTGALNTAIRDVDLVVEPARAPAACGSADRRSTASPPA